MNRREHLITRLKQSLPSSFLIRDPSTRNFCESLREIVLQIITELNEIRDEPLKKRFDEVAEEDDKKNDQLRPNRKDWDVEYVGKDSIDIHGRDVSLVNDEEEVEKRYVYSGPVDDDTTEPSWNHILNVLPFDGSITKAVITDSVDTNNTEESLCLKGDEDISNGTGGDIYIYTVDDNNREWRPITDVIQSGAYVTLECEDGYPSPQLKLTGEDDPAKDISFGSFLYSSSGGWVEFKRIYGWNDLYIGEGNIFIEEREAGTEMTPAKFIVSLLDDENISLEVADGSFVYTKDGWRTFHGSEGISFDAVSSIELIPPDGSNGDLTKSKLRLRGDGGDVDYLSIYSREGGADDVSVRSWKSLDKFFDNNQQSDYVYVERSGSLYRITLKNGDVKCEDIPFDRLVFTDLGWYRFPSVDKWSNTVEAKDGGFIVVDETPPAQINNGSPVKKYSISLLNSESSSGDLSVNDKVYTTSGWKSFNGAGESVEVDVITSVNYSELDKRFTYTGKHMKIFGQVMSDISGTVFTATPHWMEHVTSSGE